MDKRIGSRSRMKYFCIAAVAVLLGACSTQQDPDALAAVASRHEREGDLAAAEIELKNALKAAPERGDIRWQLAHVYLSGYAGELAEKELRAARKYGYTNEHFASSLVRAMLLQNKNVEIITEYAAAVAPGPTAGSTAAVDSELAALVGHAYLGEHKFADADDLYDLALGRDADQVEALHGKASVAIAERQYDMARELLNRAVTADPRFAAAWANLGALENHLLNLEAAEDAYSHAIEARSTHAQHYFERFNVRLRQKDFDGAAQDLKEFSRRSGLKYMVHFARGLYAFHRQDYAGANAAFEESLAEVVDYVPALAYAGLTNAILGRSPERALAQLSSAVDRAPYLYEAVNALAILRYRIGDYDGARKAAGDVLAAQPSNETALKTYASAALAAGNTEEAIRTLGMLMSGGDAPSDLRMQMGVGLISSGALDEGLKELEAAAFADRQDIVPQVMLFYTYLRSGAPEKAEAIARSLSEALPENPTGANLLGGVALSRGDTTEARVAFESALKIAPGDPSAAHNLATLDLLDGNVDAARDVYEQVLTHNAGHIKTLVALSDLAFRKGDFATARKRLDEALQHQPDNAEAKYSMARFLANTNDLDGSLKILDELLASHPDDAATAELIAEIRLAQFEPQRAVAVLLPAVERSPQAAGLRLLLAQAFVAVGDIAAARNEIRNALVAERSDPRIYLKAARLLIDVGDLGTSKTIIDELAARSPDKLDIAVLLGSHALAAGDVASAREIFSSKLEQNAGHRELTLLLARAEARGGDREASAKRLLAWLEKNSGDTPVRAQLASVYLATNRNDEAIREYRRVVEEQPNHAEAWNNLAWLLRESDAMKALECAERAAKLQPESTAILDTLAVLLTDGGQPQRAIELLRKAIQRAPDIKDLSLHLAQAHLAAGDINEARALLSTLVAAGDQSSVTRQARELLSALR